MAGNEGASAAVQGGGQATRVCVRGRLQTFDAPVNGAALLGLRLEASSAQAVRLGRC